MQLAKRQQAQVLQSTERACDAGLPRQTFASSTPFTSSNFVLDSSWGFMSGLCMRMPLPTPRSSRRAPMPAAPDCLRA